MTRRLAGAALALSGCGLLGYAPPDSELVRESFGSVTVDDYGLAEVDVEVPAGAVSTLAWCGDMGDNKLGTVWSVTDPAGTEVYNGYAPDAGGFRSDTVDDLIPGLLPTTPELLPTPGTWHFTFYADDPSVTRVDCGAVHRVDSLSGVASVYVEFVVVSVGTLDATTIQTDPNWLTALDALEAAWSSGGLSPTYGYADFRGDVDRYAVVDLVGDDYSEFNDLLRTANPAGSRTLTVFLVEEISSGGGATILGLAGGPPGGATLNGTSKSGMIVTTADLAANPADVGKIIAHEGGHFLGLYHTTEKDGSRSDPLGDTPTGGASSSNLMWWTLADGPGTLTGDQSFVVRSNPVAD